MALYRVSFGKHVGPGPKGCNCDRCIGDKRQAAENEKRANEPGFSPKAMKGHLYSAGDIVESEHDLVAMFRNKFTMVDERGRIMPAAPPQPPKQSRKQEPPIEDALEHMTLTELRAYAASEEIDLGDATRKEDVLTAIRSVVPA